MQSSPAGSRVTVLYTQSGMTPRGVKLTLWLVGTKPYKFSLSLKVLLIQLLLMQSQFRHESVLGKCTKLQHQIYQRQMISSKITWQTLQSDSTCLEQLVPCPSIPVSTSLGGITGATSLQSLAFHTPSLHTAPPWVYRLNRQCGGKLYQVRALEAGGEAK